MTYIKFSDARRNNSESFALIHLVRTRKVLSYKYRSYLSTRRIPLSLYTIFFGEGYKEFLVGLQSVVKEESKYPSFITLNLYDLLRFARRYGGG